MGGTAFSGVAQGRIEDEDDDEDEKLTLFIRGVRDGVEASGEDGLGGGRGRQESD
jgi:hypothetical protein